MRSDRRSAAVFASFYFFFYAAVSVMVNYLNIYLENCRGFTGSLLGLYNGLANLTTVFVLPFLGAFAGRLGGYRRALLLFSGGAVLSTAAIQWQSGAVGLVLLGCLESISKTCAMTAGDTQISDRCLRTHGNYGAVRSFGSMGYALGSLLLGFLAAELGLGRTLLPAAASGFLLAFGAAAFFPKENGKRVGTRESQTIRTWDALKELAGNSRYRFLIFITLFSALTLDCNLNYIGNHLVSTLGASERIISLNTACCVIPEVLFLPVVSRTILPQYGYRALYRFSAVVLVLRCVFYLVVQNPLLFALGSLFHCVAIGCNPVAGLAYAADSTRPELYGTAVSVYVMSQSIGRAVYGYACGWLYERWGSFSIFAVLLVINLISAGVVFTAKQIDGPGREAV